MGKLVVAMVFAGAIAFFAYTIAKVPVAIDDAVDLTEALDAQLKEQEQSIDGLRQDSQELQKKNADLLDKMKKLAIERDEALARLDAISAQAEKPGVATASTLPLAYGEFANLKALLNADWPELAEALLAMGPKMAEFAKALEDGEMPGQEFFQELGAHNMKLVALAFSLNNKLPTHDKFLNGTYTHPAAAANLATQMLETSGIPLTDGQREKLASLGESYESEWGALDETYDDSTLRLTKFFDEVELKGAFYDGMDTLMTADQRGMVFTEDYRDRAMLDLFSPSLMFQTSGQVVPLESADQLRPKLISNAAKYLGLDVADLERNGHIFDRWVDDTRGLLREPTPQMMLNNYHLTEAIQAGRAQERAIQALMDSYEISEEVMKRLLDETAFFVPRLVTTLPPTETIEGPEDDSPL